MWRICIFHGIDLRSWEYVDGYRDNGYRNYEIVERLLKKYGYDVPIVDAFTGKG